ncbi:unnamed protein product [Mytilus edulis]|uniref:Apple domain-containing protein n=1 Tax=Mytilus edulis TaxID=6550 RepID=A0A8S3SZ50_MYTED|nr:unnamed protein product [Mytilus edulis]
MNDQKGKSGSDDDWITAYLTSVDECKQYCLQTKACVAVHYEHDNNYCFVYNRTSTVFIRLSSTYSQKHCADTQKLEIRCYPPESTLQSNQVSTTEDTVTTKLKTLTKPTSDNQLTVSTTQSTIERDKEYIKDTHPSFLVALIIAIIGCTVAVIFAGTTLFYKRQLLTQKSKSPLASSVNYVDLSVARDDSDYSAINTQVVNEQYETVNART